MVVGVVEGQRVEVPPVGVERRLATVAVLCTLGLLLPPPFPPSPPAPREECVEEGPVGAALPVAVAMAQQASVSENTTGGGSAPQAGNLNAARAWPCHSGCLAVADPVTPAPGRRRGHRDRRDGAAGPSSASHCIRVQLCHWQ